MNHRDDRPEDSKPRVTVVDEPQALTAYLDDLLQEIAEVTPLPSGSAPPPAPVKPAPVRAIVTPIKPVPIAAPPAPPAPAQDCPPAWAQKPFQCLLFRLGGVTLAIPLVKLTGIMTMPREITPMPGHSSLFLGLTEHHGRKVKVVDISPHVLPPDRLANRPPPGNLILIDEGRWGLVCDRVEETLTLSPELVRWRSPSGKRPWLSGTVIKHLCAILDADYLARSLEKGTWG
ncbi:chemotaxis protein CheW [Ectothiorhodospira lacustris]|uniref:chemotaxis protein CheW n=1 Tax=Ectothiorhodospira lacustris TaxID=2899127 RepID=UPI001EE7AC01|nr:chemotaxis protein CheW [Ectothiorhodospira lacustris]MCG5499505.1 chemotaxis protein CheW [Ectothiorhodospira lacustris]MCG5511083.1 chemotaxis protein CheW [Ectothiorhodospira lacustris]MCG5522909.1 chemotaxis protein CheW [Ectothiorhodospira lacustris]